MQPTPEQIEEMIKNLPDPETERRVEILVAGPPAIPGPHRFVIIGEQDQNDPEKIVKRWKYSKIP